MTKEKPNLLSCHYRGLIWSDLLKLNTSCPPAAPRSRKYYTVVSKIALVICFCFILLAVVNGFTGFINSSISLSGTIICIIGFGIAIFAITILENERQKRLES